MPRYLPIVNPAQPINWASPLNRGLVSWWLNLPSNQWRGGTVFRDLNSIYGNDLPLNGSPTWQGPAARRGGFGSILLNGSSQYLVTSGNATTFNLTNTITAAIWAYPTAIASTRHYVFDYQSLAGTGWSTEILDSTGFKMRFTVAGVATYDTAAGVITTNSWQHLVWVFDTNANTVTFYVNGASVGQATSVGDIISVSNPFGIGRRNANGDRYFSGAIDDARVYSIAMTDVQVAALYKSSCAGYPNELNWVRRTVFPGAAASGGFKAAWAYRRNLIIGGGVT